MKKRTILSVLFLISILFFSGCSNENTFRDTNDLDSQDLDNETEQEEVEQEEVEQEEVEQEEVEQEEIEQEQEEVGQEEVEEGTTWEDVYEDTQCDGNEAIDVIFELVESGATSDEIMDAMCNINCEEMNPESFSCS